MYTAMPDIALPYCELLIAEQKKHLWLGNKFNKLSSELSH